MPTDKPRIQVTLDEQTHKALSMLANKGEQSRSALAADLIRQAIELQEDHYLSDTARSRDTRKTSWVNHDDAW